MLVPYETYLYYTPSEVAQISESQYKRAAITADAFVSAQTLGRAEEVEYTSWPDALVMAYCLAIDSTYSTFNQSGEVVSSFSNGVDSFTFDNSKTVAERLLSDVQPLIDALPIEWISRVANYGGVCDED